MSGRGARRWAAVGAVALIGVMTGACSGDDTAKDDATTTTAAGATTTLPGATTTLFSPVGLPPMPGGELECTQLADWLTKLGASAASTKSAGEVTDEVTQLRADLPPVLQADFDTMVEVYQSITSSPTNDPGKIDAKVNGPEVVDASGRLQLYLEQSCAG